MNLNTVSINKVLLRLRNVYLFVCFPVAFLVLQQSTVVFTASIRLTKIKEFAI